MGLSEGERTSNNEIRWNLFGTPQFALVLKRWVQGHSVAGKLVYSIRMQSSL